MKIFSGFIKTEMQLLHFWHTTHTHWPDNREKDGSTADEVDQKEDVHPQVVFTWAFLCGLDDDVGDISQDLEDDRSVSGSPTQIHRV